MKEVNLSGIEYEAKCKEVLGFIPKRSYQYSKDSFGGIVSLTGFTDKEGETCKIKIGNLTPLEYFLGTKLKTT